MPLAETLVLQLGPAVAKAILKQWLKDSTIAEDVSLTLVDIISRKTADVRAQKRAERQFAEIGERVAENLRPVFEREGGLDEGAREAIALQVAQTLNRSPLTPEILIARELDPAKLTQYLIDLHPIAKKDFSLAEYTLYKRILSEVSQHIIDIASQLPAFEEKTFSAILKQGNQLLEKVEAVLQEVDRIRESSIRSNPDFEAARFEEQYRRQVVRKLDELELFGIDASQASKRHRLSTAYIALDVVRGETLERKLDGCQLNLDVEDSEATETVDVADFLAENPRLLVRGSAGSGKTTLLQWIAVRSASQDFDDGLTDWNGTIPFFIRLRHFTGKDLPHPEDFPRLVAPALAGTMPPGWVHKQLEADRGIVLVDGLDEVSEAQREPVGNWIRDLLSTFPSVRVIATSRPHAADEMWMAPDGFSRLNYSRWSCRLWTPLSITGMLQLDRHCKMKKAAVS